MTEDLKYPIGSFRPTEYSPENFTAAVAAITHLPEDLEMALAQLDNWQLQTPYREGGWTVHQLVHHIADSHMNAFIRMKLALTEDHPTLKAYDENTWVLLNDVKDVPVNVSVTLLHALHRRWTVLLNSLAEEDLKRTIFHPVSNRDMSCWFLISLYAWHGRHHVAHITSLRNRNQW
jgi:uncharacterized damage-inducible protein DinB